MKIKIFLILNIKLFKIKLFPFNYKILFNNFLYIKNLYLFRVYINNLYYFFFIECILSMNKIYLFHK